MELDGHGGRCRTHESWRMFRVWLPGYWPPLEELKREAGEQVPGVGRRYSERLAELIAAARQRLDALAAQAISDEWTARQIQPFQRGAFVGFRHFCEGYLHPRPSYARAVERTVLDVLHRLQLVEHHQVEGISHLFYDLELDPPGPGAPTTPGVQLVISDRVS